MVLKELFAMVILILFVGGVGYWIFVFFQKYRFVIKYKIFKRPYNENDVKKLIQYLDAKMTANDVAKLILLSPTNQRSASQVREIIYIYSELQKLERGVTK